MYPDLAHKPLPKPVILPIPEIPKCLSDFDPEINMDLKENMPFQEGVISEMYQEPISHTSKNHKNWIV